MIRSSPDRRRDAVSTPSGIASNSVRRQTPIRVARRGAMPLLASLLAVIALVGQYPGGGARAASRVLDRIDVHQAQGAANVTVRFNLPVRFVRYSPASRGDILRVELQIAPGAGLTEAELGGRETLSWKPTEAMPLREVTYEGGNPGRRLLIFRFARRIPFRVAGGADFRSVTVAMTPSARGGVLPGRRAADNATAPPTTEKGLLAPKLLSDPTSSASADKAAPLPAIDTSFPYVINLLSSTDPIQPAALPDDPALRRYRLYVTRVESGGQVWHRLRLGFFATKADAERQASAGLRKSFPALWIVRVSKKERAASSGLAMALPPRSSKAIAESGAAAPDPSSPGKQANLFEEARNAMTAGNFRRAIQLYTKILRDPGHKNRQQAKELLGLARERNGQAAHAKGEYEEYLRQYPKGEGAERVRQRLAGLLTARAAPRQKLQSAKRQAGEDRWDTNLYGSFSQFYSRDESFTDLQGKVVNQSALSNDLDLSGRARNDTYDIRSRFSGGLVQDVYTDNPPERKSRVSSMYIDGVDRRRGISGRMGRQSRSVGGVLGRFDGVLLGYQVTPKVRINGVSGFPVDRTTSPPLEVEKYFYGVSLDLGTFAEHWDGNIFLINQEADGVTDRRATGGEVRYFDTARSGFSLVDYDMLHNRLNTFLLNGSWRFADETNVNFSLDYRKSPILTTSNALQGQPFDSLSQMLNGLSEEQVRDLARDRTATSRSMTVGASRPLTKKLQVSGDLTISDFSSTVASGGVEATPATGPDFLYSTQLIGSNLLKEGDIAILGFSYGDANNSDTFVLTLNTRYPVNRDFRVNPKLRADFRQNESDGTDRIRVSPSLRLNYRWRKVAQFEFEGGTEWTNDRRPEEFERSFGYFITLGYRVDF